MKVFYAEDDQMMQKMVAYSLIRMGHEVITVDNGKEALETLKSESFDFIILDLFLPYYSGLDLAKILKQELKTRTPIIILSRSGMDYLKKQAKEIGVDEYLTKPIEPDLLLLKMKKYTGTASG
ncbi:MAG: response regulator transcription factor [Bacteroidales bacterium]|nr:response regulator transcription factor [Bacteroidales bacterium]MBN2819466.1 response regulator transcription factor [Bacteroidales bacterium]